MPDALFLAISLAATAGAGPQAAAAGPYLPAYRTACIRSLSEFAYELSSAIESGDVNRFATLYRWHGTSTRAGYETMGRLQAIVARPLLQVSPIYPAPPAGTTRPPDAFAADPAAPLDSPDPFLPALPPRGPPIALRLDQTLANGVTPAPTTLRLSRDAGCWWVSL